MRLPRITSSTLYLYDQDFVYTGISYPTFSTAHRELSMDKSTLNKYLNDGKVHDNFTYSNTIPE